MDDQSHEITAIPRWLELLDRSGVRVTSDVRGGPKKFAAQVVAGGGDSLLAVEDNQPPWHPDLDAWFLAAWETDLAGLEPSVAWPEETPRGRDELRECQVLVRPTGLEAALWRGRTGLGLVLCRRVIEGVERVEFRDSLGRWVGTAEASLRAIRGPWGLENSGPGVLEVVFREDDSRHPAGPSGENLALRRKLALSLGQQEKSSEASLKTQRLRCGWEDDYLAKVLAANNIEDA